MYKNLLIILYKEIYLIIYDILYYYKLVDIKNLNKFFLIIFNFYIFQKRFFY